MGKGRLLVGTGRLLVGTGRLVCLHSGCWALCRRMVGITLRWKIIIMIVIIIIMIIIIAFIGAVRDFLQSPRCAVNCLQHFPQMAKAQSCDNHVQYIERLSRATCYVPLGTKGQLSYEV